jgi:hypothetical protein
MGRAPVLAATVAIILLLVGLTIAAASQGGINAVGVVVTVLVLALLGFGVLGALWSRPPDE